MPNDDGGGFPKKEGEEGSGCKSSLGSSCCSKVAFDPLRIDQKVCGDRAVTQLPTISIVISQPEEAADIKVVDEKVGGVAALKKICLSRSESLDEQCRVCQQQTEEPLVDLGCRCRGELAKVHRSCIDIWFRIKGSNMCEICQQVAANIPLPEPQPSTNYWVWRVDSAYRGGRGHGRGCFSPLWIAFAILVGGLLLDVLISISLGVSALPVNIIIGVLIVLGLGTALRLALDCCHEWGSGSVHRVDMSINSGYHTAV